MAGLQEVQVESMRRLTAGLTEAIGEAQLTLQVGHHPLCARQIQSCRLWTARLVDAELLDLPSSESKCKCLQEEGWVDNVQHLHPATLPTCLGSNAQPSWHQPLPVQASYKLQVISHSEDAVLWAQMSKCLAIQDTIVLSCYAWYVTSHLPSKPLAACWLRGCSQQNIPMYGRFRNVVGVSLVGFR